MMNYLPGRKLRTGREWIPLALMGFGLAVLVCFEFLPVGWSLIVGIGLIVVPIAINRARKQRVAAFNRQTRVGLEFLEQMRWVDAEREFATAEQAFRWPRFLSRLSAYNRAMAMLKQGRHEETIALLGEVDRAGGVIGLDPAIASNLAYVYALVGNVQLAEEWLRETRLRTTNNTGMPNILPEIAVDIRAGRAADVRKRLDDQWRSIEAALTGTRLRPVRVLRAFAIAVSSDMRDSGAIEHVIAGLRPARYDEFAYLGKNWPELDQFLRTTFTGTSAS